MTVVSNSFREFLDDLEQTVQSTATRLMSLTEEETQQRRSNEDWSRKEILGHLIDSAANNHQRFVRAQFTNDLVFSGYEQDKWVDVQRYKEAKWSRLVELWKHYNLHLLHLASHIPAHVLTQPRGEHNLDQIAWQRVEKNQPATLEYFIRDYAGHLRHHLSQIFADKDTQTDP